MKNKLKRVEIVGKGMRVRHLDAVVGNAVLGVDVKLHGD